MVRLSVAALFTCALSVYALGDPAGAKNVGNGNGGQFIGGQCLSNADCASACCAAVEGGALCSGVGAQFQAGKKGCGSFENGGAAPPPPQSNGGDSNTGNAGAGNGVAIPAGFNTAVGDPNGAKNLGNGNGQQFITGACLSNADCASGCCAALNGGAVCSGVGAQFQNGKAGCGSFENGGAAPQSGANNGGSNNAAAPPASPAVPAGFNAAVGDPAGAKNLGNGQGQQFITGACLSNADCASACCAALNGGAVCSGVGAQFQNGKAGCGSFENGGAAKRSVERSRIARIARSFRA